MHEMGAASTIARTSMAESHTRAATRRPRVVLRSVPACACAVARRAAARRTRCSAAPPARARSRQPPRLRRSRRRRRRPAPTPTCSATAHDHAAARREGPRAALQDGALATEGTVWNAPQARAAQGHAGPARDRPARAAASCSYFAAAGRRQRQLPDRGLARRSHVQGALDRAAGTTGQGLRTRFVALPKAADRALPARARRRRRRLLLGLGAARVLQGAQALAARRS